MGEIVGPTALNICASKSLVLVFPCEPVIPITVKFSKRERTNVANVDNASTTSFTTMQGPSIRRDVSEKTEPAR